MVMSCTNDLDNGLPNSAENGDWIRITSRRKKQSKHKTTFHPSILRPSESGRSQMLLSTLDDCDWDALVKKFGATRSHYLDSKIGRSFVDGLLESLNQAYSKITNGYELQSESISVLCLGLGNPSTDEASMRQLAVLDALLSLDQRFSRSRTKIYDPLLQMCSRKLIQDLGMQVLTDNKEGCYDLDPQFYHFVILPHCAPALLNNLLYTNWNPQILGRVVLYSNGWSEVRQELLATGETESLIAQNLFCIHALEPALLLPDKHLYLSSRGSGEPQSFEGMRIQCFPPSKLDQFPKTLWTHSSSKKPDKSTDPNGGDFGSSSERFYSDLISRDLIPCYVDQLND